MAKPKPALFTALAVVIGLGIGVSINAWLFPKPAVSQRAIYRVLPNEVQPLLQKYGEPLYSSHYEELFIRDFFADQKGGVFVDIGASHYRDRSNTYYLERHLGWSGIAVDPIEAFAADYRLHRPRTKYFAMFVSDKSNETAELYVGERSLFSSTTREMTERHTKVAKAIESPTITLNDLLDSQGMVAIDFLSIDVELHEPEVLAGLDLTKYRPRLICIEAFPEVRQQILDYFARGGYIVVGRYLRADPLNLWFAALDGSRLDER